MTKRQKEKMRMRMKVLYNNDPVYREKHMKDSLDYYYTNRTAILQKRKDERKANPEKFKKPPDLSKACITCGFKPVRCKYCKDCAKLAYREQHQEASRNFERRKRNESKE